jgi:bifunctional DNA-binding transcriptional regulator/antitoxin component of YhaV-PrlF toxin-antitoxin module
MIEKVGDSLTVKTLNGALMLKHGTRVVLIADDHQVLCAKPQTKAECRRVNELLKERGINKEVHLAKGELVWISL